MHPVVFELIRGSQKTGKESGLQGLCGYGRNCGTAENMKELLPYGVDEVFVYEHEGFADSRQTAMRMPWRTAFPGCALRLF